MNYRSATILAVGILFGGLLVACNTKREPDLLPAAHAQAAEANGQAPPGIKKGVKLEFATVANHPRAHVYAPHYDESPVVEDVKGNWVSMKYTPGKDAPKDSSEYVVWVNFTNVVYYLHTK